MAKLNELVYDVREAVKQYTDDSELDDRYIKYLYNTKRSKYLRQDLNNYLKTIDNSIQQTFCVDLEEVSVNECSVDADCETLLRTKVALPKPLELHSKTAITKVKPATKISVPFNFVTKERIVMLEGSNFPNSIYAFLDVDNRIYLYSKSIDYKLLNCLNITGVFENPLDLANYKDCCDCDDVVNNSCYDENTSEYPLQPHYIDVIRMEIIQELIGLKQVLEDKDNNTND